MITKMIIIILENMKRDEEQQQKDPILKMDKRLE